jgi:hypothetical protein
MLGMKRYPREYVDKSRSKVAADVAAFRKLAAKTTVDGFESTFFNNMVLVLDHLFVHRLRTVEGKDGNALNEVRVLGDSIMDNNGILLADKSIKLSPAKSVLKYEQGDQITLSEAQFKQLSKAYFDEIERKFV